MKLLVVHGYEPSGHASAAVALADCAKARGLDVLRVNISADYHPLLGPLIAKTYLGLINRFPGLWRRLYDDPLVAVVASAWQGVYLRLGGRKLARRLQEIAPDAVVCTSAPPMAAIALAKARAGLRWPLIAVPTDFKAHGYWIKPMADLYLTSSADCSRGLTALGVPQTRVRETGIPVHPAFSRPLETAAARKVLSIPISSPVVVVSGGSRGLGRLGELCAAVLSVPKTRVLALCGSSEAARRVVAARFAGEPRVRAFGALTPEQVREVMGACDLVVGKAGGLTSAEALALGLPMIVFEPIPGQEARNAAYLTIHGAALQSASLPELCAMVARLLAPGALDEMRERARALGKPDAADRCLDAITTVLRRD